MYGEQYTRPADALASVPVPNDAEKFTEEERLVLADLGLVLKLLPVRDIRINGGEKLWKYFGGPAFMEHGKFLTLVKSACRQFPLRFDDKSDMVRIIFLSIIVKFACCVH